MPSDSPLEVLVTGATGLAGSHTVRALLSEGHRVRAFVRSPEKAARIFGKSLPGLEFAKGDIGDRESVHRALEGCTGVVHSAAIVSIDNMDPQRLIATNVAGVENVIGGALDHGIDRVVHVSSLASMFHGDATHITEDSEPLASIHAYGQSKYLAERYVRDLQAAGEPVKITYPSAIVAPDDPGLTESMNAVRIFASVVVVLTTGGFQFVDARDLALAHVRLLEAPPGPGRYLTAGHFLPWTDLADRLAALEGTRVHRVPCPPSLLRACGRFFDVCRKVVPISFPITHESCTYVTKWNAVTSSNALLDLGVRFRDPDETLRDAIAWMRANGHI